MVVDADECFSEMEFLLVRVVMLVGLCVLREDEIQVCGVQVLGVVLREAVVPVVLSEEYVGLVRALVLVVVQQEESAEQV